MKFVVNNCVGLAPTFAFGLEFRVIRIIRVPLILHSSLFTLNLKNMIEFLLGAAVGAAIVLLNLAGLLFYWHRDEKKGGRK